MRKIASVATELDYAGLTKEAKAMDSILLKLAEEENGMSDREKLPGKWKNLDYYKKLSEEYIRENADSIDQKGWNYISSKPILSEDFIREFADRLDWEQISRKQPLSDKFINEFEDYVDWYALDMNPNISNKMKKQLRLMGLSDWQ